MGVAVHRRSTDGGATWTTAAKLSDATGGAAHKTPTGFMEPYGDDGELGVTSAGTSIAVWGEGTSYDGPGGVWLNRGALAGAGSTRDLGDGF